MVKLLHVSLLQNLGTGHAVQLKSEQQAAIDLRSLGIHWETVALVRAPSANASVQYAIPGWAKNFQLHKLYAWLWILRKAKDYDFLLLRATPADPFAFPLMLFVPNLITMHHAKELEEIRLLRNGVRRRVAIFLESQMKPLGARRLRGVAAATGEILSYQLARFPSAKISGVYLNGIDYTSNGCAEDARSRDGLLNIVFVASSFYAWHGLDALLDELDGAEDALSLPPFVLHLVGTIGEEDRARITRLASRWSIRVHGDLDAKGLSVVYASADIAIGSLGLHRAGLTEGSTLKVREYLASGIPVYATHKDAAFEEDFPYFFHDGEGASLANILRFAGLSRSFSREEVRRRSQGSIEKSNVMISFVEALTGQVLRTN